MASHQSIKCPIWGLGPRLVTNSKLSQFLSVWGEGDVAPLGFWIWWDS